MADSFVELDQKKIQTHEGIAELNRMLQFLFNAVAGDGDQVRVYTGFGSPSSVVQARIGSLYLRQDGGAGSTVYVKESGTDASGWAVLSGGGGGAPIDATYLTVSLNGTLSDERVLTAGDNITITDGGANGTLTIDADTAVPGGADTNVQFNDVGAFGGDSDFTWSKTTNILGINGNINFLDTTNSTKEIKVSNQTDSNTAGNDLDILGSNGLGTGAGGDISIWGGDGGATGTGGNVSIYSGYSGAGGGGGNIRITASDGGDVFVNNDDGGTVTIGGTNTNQIYYTTGTVSGGGADHFFTAGDSSGTGEGGCFYFTTGDASGSNKDGGLIYVDFGNPTGTGLERILDFGVKGSLTAERPAVKFGSGLGATPTGAWTVSSGSTVSNQRFFQFIAPTINGVAGGGAETVTNCATLYIDAAPSGSNVTITNPYAFWVDSGLSRFDGNGTHVFELPADATDPTGGGGAATGRIPVTIGGATRYIAYY